MRTLGVLLGTLLSAAAAAEVQFTPAEFSAILAHGPWPTPVAPDPTNRASGRRAAVELGERLFFDPRLSADGRFSCGTCHVPERNWTDNKVRGAAAAEVDRNTPTLMNARLGRWYGWDGAADSLWSQSVRPILDRRELGATPRHVAELMRGDEELSCRYRRTFGAAPSPTDDEEVLVNVGKILAAFQETFETPPTPFDKFRNALARGERRYAIPMWRGADCAPSSPTAAAVTAARTSPMASSATTASRMMPGASTASRRCVPAASTWRAPTTTTRRSACTPPRSPSAARSRSQRLRHLMLTAPYGHDGKRETLADVVRHYSEKGSAALPALKLSAAEQTELVVFLESVSTLSNPWRPEDHARCH